MKKKYLVAALLMVVALAVVILSVLYVSLAPEIISDGFEQDAGQGDIGEWFISGHVPQDPNNPGHTVQWHVKQASNISLSGVYSVELFIDGRQDDGAIWLERKINVKKDSQIRVSVSFWLYSEEESFNTIAAVVAYAGKVEPQAEDEFEVLGSANEVAGWKNYGHTASLSTGAGDDAWVAVGISVRWETYMTYYIDDVRIETT